MYIGIAVVSFGMRDEMLIALKSDTYTKDQQESVGLFLIKIDAVYILYI